MRRREGFMPFPRVLVSKWYENAKLEFEHCSSISLLATITATLHAHLQLWYYLCENVTGKANFNSDRYYKVPLHMHLGKAWIHFCLGVLSRAPSPFTPDQPVKTKTKSKDKIHGSWMLKSVVFLPIRTPCMISIWKSKSADVISNLIRTFNSKSCFCRLLSLWTKHPQRKLSSVHFPCVLN